ncbi:autotransporter outer membrane beta-barrel domain-containing protein [Termitidicoccus mucosus]|uniref:Autotransporter domain-containing protein n=1 Tax=Termitidicoccus mucosus TaxID=1184151 RepID=A0A178INY4_9BACT|nr:hypothetical protein AW736_02030 [Opitutaceae bacterium TSB47]
MLRRAAGGVVSERPGAALAVPAPLPRPPATPASRSKSGAASRCAISSGWRPARRPRSRSSALRDYATSDGDAVRLDRATAWQTRARLRAGADLGRWSPHIKFAEVRSDTSGGALHADGRSRAPAFDGWRFGAGLGSSWFIDERSQLYFDYEYNKAPAYERPWSLNLGYRRDW